MNIAVDPPRYVGKFAQAVPTAAQDTLFSNGISASCLTGLACLVAASREIGMDLSLARLIRTYARDSELTAADLAQVAEREGTETAIHALSWSRLSAFAKSAPFLARLVNGDFVTVLEISRPQTGITAPTSARIFNPRVDGGQGFSVSQENFTAHWSGEIILLKRAVKSASPEKFGLRWLFAQFLKQRSLLANVAGAAVLLHILSLAVPIFFQIVVDRVLVYLNISTLVVITIGVAAAIVFDTILTWLRGYFILNAAARLDMQLARLSFSKLVSLPISFFAQARVGVVTRHMQQATQIREFLTGRLLTTILDLPALLILLPLLLWYSPLLTAIVLGVTAILGGAISLIIQPYRRRLLSLYTAEAERQSLLVESIQGMRTIKSLNLEMRRERTWNDASATAIRGYQNVGTIALTTSAFSGFMEKVLGVTIVVAGTFLVFSNHLTVGALVAFNMLALRLTAPIMQVIGLMSNYQETLLSVQMLGEVMNAPSESTFSCLAPELEGDIEFDSVNFRYPGSDQLALRDISLRIPAGALIGVVGRSGSGKTTFSSLLQGLNRSSEGTIRIDGYNVEDLDLGHLRGQIGTVPQEAFLFRGTIRDNIGLGREGATFEDIVQAARMAGADEFIQKLSRRFESQIEENGVNLSGGQKQRLAIARAILRNPKIMIFDEATSALDPDSEAIVMDNLRRMAAGRTTIIISHRLYTVRSADMIVVLGDGGILDTGTHDELLTRNDVYRSLWAQQGFGG